MTKSHAGWWALDPTITYLDHGAFGACPTPVLDEQARLQAEMERQPSEFFMHSLEPRLDAARAALSVVVNARVEDLVLIPNATAGINAVLRAYPLQQGDEILVTNHGYSACAKAARFTAERRGAKVVEAVVPFPTKGADEVVERVLASVTPKTRLAIIDHVTSATGLVFPIARLVRELQARGVDTLVDGAHAPGMVPVDLESLGATYYVATCHKWLCAPKGSAFLWANRAKQDSLHPTSISHGWKSFRDDRPRLHLEFDWTGTDDPTPYLCIPTAISFLSSLDPDGLPGLMRANRARALAARAAVCGALGRPPPAPDDMIGALVSVPIREARDEEYGDDFATDPLHKQLLARYRIDVLVTAWPEWPKRVLRVSSQAYNDEDQFERLADALSELDMTAGD